MEKNRRYIILYIRYIKRVLDILISIICIVFLLPVYVIVAILIKIIDKDKILFMQNRTGLYGKEFKILKFKTMKNKQITKLGRFFRNTSIDELPQFFNVLKGDMSIIGPRPWIPEYYKNFNNEQKKRVEVRPGLVGLAQTNGRRKISIFEKIDLDLKYINNLSFTNDFIIFIKSFKTIFEEESAIDVDNYITKEIEALRDNNI